MVAVKRQWEMIAPRLTLEVRRRFWSRVERGGENDCWNWTGTKNRLGYGAFAVPGIPGQIPSHRIAYGLANNGIPKGLHCLHQCDNPPCCNPAHLFVGTHWDNMQDMLAKGRHGSRYYVQPSHCPRGHEYTPENCMPRGETRNGVVRRVCRACYKQNLRVATIDRRMRKLAALHRRAVEFLPADIDELIDIAGSTRAYVICSFFGVFGHQKKTLEEIGAELGVSRERARQQRNAGLNAVREARQSMNAAA